MLWQLILFSPVKSDDVINPVAIGDPPAHGSPKTGFEPATSQSRILLAASSATTGYVTPEANDG